ncbi:MAG: hypothetical protein WC003_10700 [Terrimicrobiaceae bacterium]
MFAIPEQIIILCRMKGVILFFSAVLIFTLSACSVADSSASGVGQQFQNGIQGRGQIVPNNPTHDSFGSDYR